MRFDKLITKMILEEWSIRKIRNILLDSQKSEFVGITIPEAMSVLETEDLLARLKTLKIQSHYMVINMI
ncbi:hypothetical protein MYX04_15240, partial [Nitrospiraceae bacterium AH_259_D15_M11_P09]|nr:hypothetical protein [Nitrospiraceae bacterium AH_259_D15_M11_P09]